MIYVITRKKKRKAFHAGTRAKFGIGRLENQELNMNIEEMQD